MDASSNVAGIICYPGQPDDGVGQVCSCPYRAPDLGKEQIAGAGYQRRAGAPKSQFFSLRAAGHGRVRQMARGRFRGTKIQWPIFGFEIALLKAHNRPIADARPDDD